MFFDFIKNRERYLQCFTRRDAIQFRFYAGTDAFEESIELEFERFACFDRDLFEGDSLRPADCERRGSLLCVVDRDVLERLEEPQFSDFVGGDAAGGEVGDAAVFEFEANVGDVHFGGEDGDTGGADLFERGAGEGEDDIEVVDHQIEHDVHIEAAQCEYAHAVNFEKQGEGCQALEREDGGVEAFEMADLEDSVVARGGFDQAVGFGQGGRDGFFDEHVEPGFEQSAADLGVGDGGNGYDRGIGVADDVAVIGGSNGSAGLGVFPGAGEIGVDNVGELGVRVFGNHANVVFAEGTGADDGNTNHVNRAFGLFAGPKIPGSPHCGAGLRPCAPRFRSALPELARFCVFGPNSEFWHAGQKTGRTIENPAGTRRKEPAAETAGAAGREVFISFPARLRAGNTTEEPGARRFSGRVAIPDHAGRKPGRGAEAPAPQGSPAFLKVRGPQAR